MTVLTAASMSNINKDTTVKIGLSQQSYNNLEEIYSRFLPKHQRVLKVATHADCLLENCCMYTIKLKTVIDFKVIVIVIYYYELSQ